MGETMMREQIPEHGLTIGEHAAMQAWKTMPPVPWSCCGNLMSVRSATRLARTFRSMRGTRFCGSGIREKFSANRGNSDAEGTGKDF